MKFGIIGAMEEEITILKERTKDLTVDKINNIEFLKGKILNHEVILVKSGIGKVNASMTVMQLVNNYKVDYIINTGSAGSLDSNLHIGEIVIAQSLTYHDVDVTNFGYVKGQMAGMPEMYYPDTLLLSTAQTVANQMEIPFVLGQIVSGDQFINDNNKIKEIKKEFPLAKACEMESAAIAQACYNLRVPFLIIRAISDNADDAATISFDEFIKVAGKVAAELVEQVIRVI